MDVIIITIICTYIPYRTVDKASLPTIKKLPQLFCSFNLVLNNFMYWSFSSSNPSPLTITYFSWKEFLPFKPFKALYPLYSCANGIGTRKVNQLNCFFMIDLTYNLKCYYVCRIYLVIATLHFICIIMKKNQTSWF